MQRILTYIETQGDKVRRASLEALSHCVTLAERLGAEPAAMVAHPSPATFVPTLAAYGARAVLLVPDPIFAFHRNEAVLSALERVVSNYKPQLVAFASSESVKDVLGAAAIRLDAAAISDAVSLEVTDGAVDALRPVEAGRRLAHVRTTQPRVLVSMRPGSFDAVQRPVSPAIETVELACDPSSLRASVREAARVAANAVDLSEATAIVAAGRGVKDAAGKRLVEELAEALGAAVGATRPTVESGLFPPTTQIGQTGKVVAPDLYVAVGISGAIQHVAAIMESRVIVAINKDPEAPIFDIATFGLVGNLYEILPLLIEQVRGWKNASA